MIFIIDLLLFINIKFIIINVLIRVMNGLWICFKLFEKIFFILFVDIENIGIVINIVIINGINVGI